MAKDMKKKERDQKQGKRQLSPEEEEQFDLFIINGMNIIYDEEFSKSMLKKIKISEDPLRATAEILVELIRRLKKSANANGKELGDSILAHGGNVLLGEILKVMEAAGMKPFSDKQKVSCWQLAVSMYLDSAIKSGEMTKEELIQKAQEVRKTKAGKKILQTAKKSEFNPGQGGKANG